jgi:MFS family permease
MVHSDAAIMSAICVWATPNATVAFTVDGDKLCLDRDLEPGTSGASGNLIELRQPSSELTIKGVLQSPTNRRSFHRSAFDASVGTIFLDHPMMLLLYIARAIRGFGDGFAIILLPSYLSALGFNAAQIGLVAAAALLGTAIFTIAIGLISPRHDLRNLLIVGAGLMIATGLAFPSFENIIIIIAVAFIGTINPSAGDLGILVPLEHAMLARGVPSDERTKAFARYSLIGALSGATGSLAAAAPDWIATLGLSGKAALKVMFFTYAALGLISAALYQKLPHAEMENSTPAAPLGPSKGIVYKLAALFSLDAFAGGFVVQSLLTLWLFARFGLSLSAASIFFFWSNLLSAFSYPVAAWLARHIGLINTMVFTHIPSSICLILAALAPDATIALGLLLVRSALSQMDVPTRTSYVMAVVTPAEQPAAASVTAVPRTLASSVSPALSGILLNSAFAGLSLILSGVLKIVYDVSLLWAFRHVKPPEERQ